MNIDLLLCETPTANSEGVSIRSFKPFSTSHENHRLKLFYFQLKKPKDTPRPPFDDLDRLANAASCPDHHFDEYDEEGVKPKRKRASQEQISELKKVFEKNPFPTTDARKRLAKKLGMTARSVQIWFQNQRQLARNFMHKRIQKEAVSNTSMDSETSMSP